MRTATKLMLGLLGGRRQADTSASFTVTTTGAQTLTLQALTVSAETTVDWGDGSSDAYTGSGARTHNYAGAGTWAVRILQPLNVTALDLRDAKITALAGEQVARMANLTSLVLWVLPGVNWTVGASAPMPAGLTSLDIRELPGVNWTVGASAPMPAGLTSLTIASLPGVNWTVGASAPMPAGLTNLLIALSGVSVTDTLQNCLALTTVRIENNLTDAAQQSILSQLYAAFPTRTATNGTIDLLGGGNAVSGGILQAANPPTTTREYAYELVNDSAGVSANHWVSVTLQT